MDNHDDHIQTPDDATSESPSAIAVVRPPRWVVPTAGIPILAVVIAGYIAGASWPELIKSNPLLLIALSPINRYLLLTTNSLEALPYFGVGLLRHLFPDPFFYLLGYWYGPRALRWAGENYPVVKRLLGEDGRGLEAPNTRRLLIPLAFLAPNNWVSLVSGAARIPWQLFIALNISGTIARLWLCRWLGTLFEDEIRSFADWVARYQLPVTLVSVGIVVATIAVQVRRGSGDLVGLTHLGDEMEPTQDD